ncbi:MAG: dihydrodipicolinate synthase family protein [Gemmataceae bacterium]|nr:dihydrodipicolinate synthase family protein [Gemmataceae bacterium]
MSKFVWQGIYPAVVTHFTVTGALDLPATRRHAEAMLAAGCHGTIALGTLGENGSLDPAEKVEVIRALAGIPGPLIAGVSETSTAAACRAAEAAAKAGAHGLMVLPALAYKADTRETITHFRTVARAAGLPVMIYNNPVSYSVDLSPEALAELADEPNLVAIKESSDDIRRITDIRNLCGDRYALFCGVDDLALEAAVLGADGLVAGLVNAFPAETVRLWDLARQGKNAEAVRLYRWFMPVLHLDCHPKLVQYIKLAVQEVGLGAEHVRPPRLPLVGDERERVLGIIRAALAHRP